MATPAPAPVPPPAPSPRHRWSWLRRLVRMARFAIYAALLLLIVVYLARDLLARPLGVVGAWLVERTIGGQCTVVALRGGLDGHLVIEGVRWVADPDEPRVQGGSCTRIEVRYSLPAVLRRQWAQVVQAVEVEGVDLGATRLVTRPGAPRPGGPPPDPAVWLAGLCDQRLPAISITGRATIGPVVCEDLRLGLTASVFSAQGRLMLDNREAGPMRWSVVCTPTSLRATGSAPGLELRQAVLDVDRQAGWSMSAEAGLAGGRLTVRGDQRQVNAELRDLAAERLPPWLRAMARLRGMDLPVRGRCEARLQGEADANGWRHRIHLAADNLVNEGGDGLVFARADLRYQNGLLEILRGALRTRSDFPTLNEASGRILFGPAGVRIEELSGQLGFAPVGLRGWVGYDGALDLALTGRNALLARTADLRLRADLDARITGSVDRPLLSGRVGITDLLYVRPITWLMPEARQGSVEDSKLQLFDLHGWPWSDLRFDLFVRDGPLQGPAPAKSAITVRTEMFDGELACDLHLGGTGAVPVPFGTISLLGGRAVMPFTVYRIEQGQIRFTRSGAFDPELSISAHTRMVGYDVTAVVEGRWSAPVVVVVTNPPLAPDEALLLASTGLTRRTLERDGSMASAAGVLVSYLARELSRSVLGPGDSDRESFFERLSVEIGTDESADGVATARMEYRLLDWLFAFGERDRFEDFNGGLLLRQVFGRRFTLPVRPRLDNLASQDRTMPWDYAGIDEGLRLTERQMRSLVQEERTGFLASGGDPAFCADAAYAIEGELQRRGYVSATVDFTIEPGPEGLPRRVLFRVAPGRQYLFGEVVVFGNQGVTTARLRDLLGTGGLFGLQRPPFSQAWLDGFTARIRRLYLLEGWADIEVGHPQLAWNHAAGRVDVVIRIEEGVQYRIAASTLDGVGNADPLRARLQAALDAMVDTTWNRRMPEAVVASLRAVLEEAGHHRGSAACTPELAADGTVRLRVTVQPGPRLRHRNLVLQGHQRTRESYLRRLFDIRSGVVLCASVLKEAERRLLKSGIMRRVDIRLEPVPGTGPEREADVVVEVEEAPARSIEVDLGWGSYEMLRGGVTLRDRNLFGRGRYFDVSARGSMVGWGLASRIRDTDLLSGILGPEQRIEVDGLYEFREEPGYDRTTVGAGIGIGYTAWWPLAIETGYRVTEQKADHVGTGLGAEEVAGFLRKTAVYVGAAYDRRDHPLLPTSGGEAHGRISWSIPALFSELDFVEYDLAASSYAPLGAGADGRAPMVLAIGARFITRDILDRRRSLPIQERLFLGGATNVRSFDYHELGPADADGDPLGGLTRFHVSTEARVRLWGAWHLAGFYDAGVVNPETWHFSGPWGQGLGAGLRWYTPVMPLRLDWAWNPGERFAADDSWAMHLAVGFSF